MTDPIQIEMPEAVQLVASGPDGGAVPVELEFISCSSCGGTMVPVRWNLWTGEIEWVCPTCGDSAIGPASDP